MECTSATASAFASINGVEKGVGFGGDDGRMKLAMQTKLGLGLGRWWLHQIWRTGHALHTHQYCEKRKLNDLEKRLDLQQHVFEILADTVVVPLHLSTTQVVKHETVHK